MNSIPQIITDIKARHWDANPIEKCFDIFLHHPEHVLELVRHGIESRVEGTYLDAAISYLPLKEFPEAVELALYFAPPKSQKYGGGISDCEHQLAESASAPFSSGRDF